MQVHEWNIEEVVGTARCGKVIRAMRCDTIRVNVGEDDTTTARRLNDDDVGKARDVTELGQMPFADFPTARDACLVNCLLLTWHRCRHERSSATHATNVLEEVIETFWFHILAFINKTTLLEKLYSTVCGDYTLK